MEMTDSENESNSSMVIEKKEEKTDNIITRNTIIFKKRI